MTERESIKVLRECIELQDAKSKDYQSKASSVKQADYYRLGVDSIYDMMHTKMLRLMSLMETAKADPKTTPKFESLEDTAKDLINYTSFFAAYIRGGVDGQDPNRDMFNREKPEPMTDLVAAALEYIESDSSPLGPGLLNTGYPNATIVGQPTGVKHDTPEGQAILRAHGKFAVANSVYSDANNVIDVKALKDPYNRRQVWPSPIQPIEEEGDKDWPDNAGH